MTAASPRRLVFLNSARQFWGAEQSMFMLVEELERQGHLCTLVAWSPALVEEWTSRGLGDAVALDADPDYHRTHDIRALLAQLDRVPDTDAVVVFSFALLPAVSAMRLRPRFRRTVFVLDLHDTIPGRKGRLLLALFALPVHRVVAVSAFTAGQVRHRGRSVLHRPVRLPVAAAAPQPGDAVSAHDGPLVVGVVGRLDPAKNHPLALRAARQASRPVRLVFRGAPAYGDTTYVGVLQAQIDALGVDAVLEGRVPGERALRDIDALLVTNAEEPLGRTVIEAMAAGVAVVVPDAGGSAELVRADETGLVYRAGDASSLARCLDRLAGDRDLRRRLVLAGARQAAEQHDPARYAANFAAAVAGTAPSPPDRATAAPVTARTAVVCLTAQGGHIEHAFNLASAAAEVTGADVVLVSRTGAADYLPADTGKVRVLEIGAFSAEPTLVGKVGRTLRESRRIAALLGSVAGLERVILEEPQTALSVPVKRGLSLAVVVHNVREHDAHEGGPAVRLREGIKRVVLVRASRVLVHGEQQADALPRAFARKVAVVPLPGSGAFEAQMSAPGPDSFAADRLLCLGEVRSNKNYEEAIEASALAGVPLVIAGGAPDADYLATLERLVAERAAPVSFHTGFLDAYEFGAALAGARAVVLPYKAFAAQSGVLERAAAVGTPVISSDIPSLVEQGGARPGIVFYPAGNAPALGELLRSVERPTGAGARGSSHAPDPGWNDVARALLG